MPQEQKNLSQMGILQATVSQLYIYIMITETLGDWLLQLWPHTPYLRILSWQMLQLLLCTLPENISLQRWWFIYKDQQDWKSVNGRSCFVKPLRMAQGWQERNAGCKHGYHAVNCRRSTFLHSLDCSQCIFSIFGIQKSLLCILCKLVLQACHNSYSAQVSTRFSPTNIYTNQHILVYFHQPLNILHC